jgi:hypothetical protein
MWSNEMLKITTQSILLRPLLSIGGCIALLTVTVTPSQSETGAIAPLPKLPEFSKPKPQLPPHLVTLQEATRLEGRALGIAGISSKIYQAFEQAGKMTRSEIDRLRHESTPSGRIYATMLLAKLDLKAGRQLLEQMRSDQTPLTEASGCEISRTTVGAAVDDILQGRSSVFPPLP